MVRLSSIYSLNRAVHQSLINYCKKIVFFLEDMSEKDKKIPEKCQYN